MGLGNSHPRHKPLFLPGLLSQRDWLGIPTNSKTWEKSHPTSYLKSEMKCSSSDDMSEKSGMCVLSKELSSWHLERWCPSQLILRSVFLSFPLDNKEDWFSAWSHTKVKHAFKRMLPWCSGTWGHSSLIERHCIFLKMSTCLTKILYLFLIWRETNGDTM